MTGQAATVSGGAGICNVFCCTASIRVRMESPSELINKAIGTTNTAIPSSTSRVAASPDRPPRWAAMRRCRG